MKEVDGLGHHDRDAHAGHAGADHNDGPRTAAQYVAVQQRCRRRDRHAHELRVRGQRPRRIPGRRSLGQARVIVASSPITGDTYRMSCAPEGDRGVSWRKQRRRSHLLRGCEFFTDRVVAPCWSRPRR